MRSFLSFFIFCHLGSVYSQQNGQHIDGVAAVIENSILLKSDLVQMINMAAIQQRIDPNNNPDAFIKLQESVLQSMVDQKIVLEMAAVDSIIVEEKEVTKSPEIAQYLQDISAQDGSQTKLVCKVTGLPRPSVTWYKEDEVIYPSEEFKLSYEGDECTLVIADVYPEDAGHYKVVAKNDVGTATTTCDLTVLGRH